LSTTQKIIIDFYKICNDYREDLNIELRDFGSKNEFMQLWVPSSDLKKSFCNLIDALKETKILEFKVLLRSDLNNEINIDFLKQIEKSIGSINIKEINSDLHLDIYVDLDNYDQNFNTHSVLENKVERKITESQDFVNFINQEINANYTDKIDNLENLDDKQFDLNKIEIDQYIKKNSFLLIKKESDDLKLYYIIDATTNTIINCYHNFITKNRIQNLLNYFCHFIKGLDVLEVSDHSIIYMEHKFRSDKNKFIGGIIMPERAGLIFLRINKINRDMLSSYRENNNYKNLINRNYPKISNYWMKLSKNEKNVKIQEQIYYFIINNKLSKEDINFIRIDRYIRVFVDINQNLDNKEGLLMSFENELKKIENRIEVFAEEIKDSNKLRWKNAPKSTIIQ
jgi:hypothetical protein